MFYKKSISSGNAVELDLSGEKSGTYYLTFKIGNEVFGRKVALSKK